MPWPRAQLCALVRFCRPLPHCCQTGTHRGQGARGGGQAQAAARSPASPDTSDHSSSASPTPGHSSLSAPYCPARSLDQPPHRRLSSVTMHSGYPAPCPVHVFCIHSKYTFLKISGLLLLLLIHSYLFPGESKLLKARAVVSC